MQEFRKMLRENSFGCKISFTEEIKKGLAIIFKPISSFRSREM